VIILFSHRRTFVSFIVYNFYHFQGNHACLSVFFECGVGRIDANGKWHMVSAMLRFQTKYTKISVIRKRTAKFSEKQVELYVHKIRLDNGQLEVCEDHETLLSAIANDEKKSIVPASSLKVGQELVGTVIELRPYGCLVDVGANRRGLLHIQKVADLYGKYINKENGLKMAGLVCLKISCD